MKYKHVSKARHGKSDYRVEIQTPQGIPFKSRSFSVETNIENSEKVLYWIFNKFSKVRVNREYKLTDKPITNQVNILVYPAKGKTTKSDSKWMTIYHVNIDEAYDFLISNLDQNEGYSS